jgi:hypothetical protein
MVVKNWRWGYRAGGALRPVRCRGKLDVSYAEQFLKIKNLKQHVFLTAGATLI